jgi:hypothetical protein
LLPGCISDTTVAERFVRACGNAGLKVVLSSGVELGQPADDGFGDGATLAQEARSDTPSFIGDSVFNKSLTVVLPIYNGEARLRKNVNEILELASELTNKFGVLIIDDGSNDSTYEVAEELAAHFPQVTVQRNRHRRGLGSVIDYAQRRVRSDAVIVHDGVTPIDAGEIRTLWRNWAARTPNAKGENGEPATMQGQMCDLANLPAIHAAMERVHGRLTGFQMVAPLPMDEAIEDLGAAASTATLRSDSPRNGRKNGVGVIPILPGPKFLTAIANFALGE